MMTRPEPAKACLRCGKRHAARDVYCGTQCRVLSQVTAEGYVNEAPAVSTLETGPAPEGAKDKTAPKAPTKHKVKPCAWCERPIPFARTGRGPYCAHECALAAAADKAKTYRALRGQQQESAE